MHGLGQILIQYVQGGGETWKLINDLMIAERQSAFIQGRCKCWTNW